MTFHRQKLSNEYTFTRTVLSNDFVLNLRGYPHKIKGLARPPRPPDTNGPTKAAKKLITPGRN